MTSAPAPVGTPWGTPARSAAQTRVVAAAIELFAEHGVGGTSLQMIADAIGVTKAAVYHQFNTKEEIVIAVAETELDRVKVAVEIAEQESDPGRARDVLVASMVDIAVERRHMESMLVGDPVIARFFTDYEPYRQIMSRLYRILLGDAGRTEDRIPAVILTAAIGGAVMHPLVAQLDDDTLRAQLVAFAHRVLDPT